MRTALEGAPGTLVLRRGLTPRSLFALSGRHVQRLCHLPLQSPQEAAARARPLVLLAAGPDGGVLLLQERGE